MAVETKNQEFDFTAYVEITKGETTPNGEWVVCGPAASEIEDMDGEIMERPGVKNGLKAFMKGLQTFQKVGGPVDFDHLYAETHDPNTLIGRAEVFEVDGRPWLRTYLRKGLALSKAVWDAVNDPNAPRMGYSLQGKGSKTGNRITNTSILIATISPLAKGFDQRLYPGAEPRMGMASLAKAVALGEATPQVSYKGQPVSTNYKAPVAKALLVGSGVVRSGDTGGAALRPQSLEGTSSAATRRKKKKRVEPALQSVSYDGLSKALAAKGITDPAAYAQISKAFALKDKQGQ